MTSDRCGLSSVEIAAHGVPVEACRLKSWFRSCEEPDGMTLRRAIGIEMRDERYDKLVGRSSAGGAETAADGRLSADSRTPTG